MLHIGGVHFGLAHSKKFIRTCSQDPVWKCTRHGQIRENTVNHNRDIRRKDPVIDTKLPCSGELTGYKSPALENYTVALSRVATRARIHFS
jgi:hypothetical protein